MKEFAIDEKRNTNDIRNDMEKGCNVCHTVNTRKFISTVIQYRTQVGLAIVGLSGNLVNRCSFNFTIYGKESGFIMVNIGNSWDQVLEGEFEKEYYQKLRQFLIAEYQTKTIYPDMRNIFNALKYTSYEKVKVVILGQDPYHEPGQAHGMSFSVMKGIKQPPSLINIFKEIKDDLGLEPPDHGYLLKWAEEGVLLLNTCLTVRAHQANSHKGKGWEIFTDRVIQLLNEREEPIVFILWGANARSKKALITGQQHMILESVHPSPLSAYNGFFGGKYFSKANGFLKNHGEEPVKWKL